MIPKARVITSIDTTKSSKPLTIKWAAKASTIIYGHLYHYINHYLYKYHYIIWYLYKWYHSNIGGINPVDRTQETSKIFRFAQRQWPKRQQEAGRGWWICILLEALHAGYAGAPSSDLPSDSSDFLYRYPDGKSWEIDEPPQFVVPWRSCSTDVPIVGTGEFPCARWNRSEPFPLYELAVVE